MPSGIYIRTKNHNRSISKSLSGKKKSKEHNKNNRLSHLGQTPWNKNLTKETDHRVAAYSKTLHKIRIGARSPNTTGKKHWNWRGGLSKNRHPVGWRSLPIKEQVRARDNHKCQLCGMTEAEHLLLYYMRLSIHHIDYNKFNMFINNLILLCASCHSKTNINRDYWYAYFNYIMENKYENVQ